MTTREMVESAVSEAESAREEAEWTNEAKKELDEAEGPVPQAGASLQEQSVKAKLSQQLKRLSSIVWNTALPALYV